MSEQDGKSTTNGETSAMPSPSPPYAQAGNFRALVENLSIGIYRATPDGRILYGNPAWVRIMGYDSLAEMQALGLEAIAAKGAPGRHAFLERLEQEGEIIGLETVWTRRDGRPIILREHARAVRGPHGRVLYYDGTVEDVTQERQAREALERANTLLTEAVRARDEMIQNVSHELRTPLTHIIGYSDLLIGGVVGGSLDADHLEALNAIRQRAETLMHLVNALLSMQGLTSERLAKEVVEVGSLTTTTLSHWQQRAAERKITLQKHIPPNLPPIYGDYNRLQEALDQILDNAFKFTEPGGMIALTAEQRGNEVWLSVSDTGIGIPPNQLEHVFDRFYQVEGSANHRPRGTGIGLALVRQIIVLHGGRVWAESDGIPGHGTTMRIALPAMPGH